MQDNEWYTFDSNDLKSNFADCRILSDVISAIEKWKWQSGEVICGLKVNGMFLSEADERRFAQTTISELESLAIKTRKPIDLIVEARHTVEKWIPIIREDSLRVSDRIRRGEVYEALQELKKIFDGCTWLWDALVLLKSLAFKEALNDEAFRSKWSTGEQAFADLTQSMTKALEGKDHVELADILEYDVANVLDNWLELFTSQNTMNG